ncbi:hypothetical protein GQ457_12G024250 [Hibiscus cannabinus]
MSMDFAFSVSRTPECLSLQFRRKCLEGNPPKSKSIPKTSKNSRNLVSPLLLLPPPPPPPPLPPFSTFSIAPTLTPPPKFNASAFLPNGGRSQAPCHGNGRKMRVQERGIRDGK